MNSESNLLMSIGTHLRPRPPARKAKGDHMRILKELWRRPLILGLLPTYCTRMWRRTSRFPRHPLSRLRPVDFPVVFSYRDLVHSRPRLLFVTNPLPLTGLWWSQCRLN